MLLTKEVKMRWHSTNKKWYESKKYIFTKIGDEFFVKVEHLTNGSNFEVDVQCDHCKKIINNVTWYAYKKCVKEDGKYYCNKCANKLRKGKVKTKYKYKINDVIKEVKSGKLKILQQILLDNNGYNQKGYKYECLICGNKDVIAETSLTNQKSGCNVCSGKKVLKEYNDLWTTHPDIAKLLKYAERGYKISYGSEKEEKFLCPDCKNERNLKVVRVVKKGFSCPKCGDGISYPNKIGFNLLEQLKLDFEFEYCPDWIKPKRYDFYFELNNKKYILEMDGTFHKKDNKLSKRSIEKSIEIDNYKNMLANEHNIEIIRIDCEPSNLKYIKNNILNSKLAQIIDLSNINWLKCHEFACSNLVKVVCKLWNDSFLSPLLISEQIKIARTTVARYLKQGVKFGWCNYNPKEASIKAGFIQGKNNGIKVIELTTMKIFNSITDAGKYYHIPYQVISEYLKGIINNQIINKQLNFMYYKDYLQTQ